MVGQYAAMYKSSEAPFPEAELEHRKKDKTWFKQMNNAILSEFYKDKTTTQYSDLEEIIMLRNFGAGTQSQEIYRKRFALPERVINAIAAAESDANMRDGFEEDARKGFMNVDWQILNLAGKFKAVMIGHLARYDHDIMVASIDPAAGAAKEDAMIADLAMGLIKKEIDAIRKYKGSDQIAKVKEKWLPQNVEEAELMAKLGRYKSNLEKVMETLLLSTFTVDSKWDEDCKILIYDDLIDTNRAACKAYICPVTGRTKNRYVDIKNFVYQWRRGHTGQSKYAGEFVVMTIDDLRATGEFEEPELKEIYDQTIRSAENHINNSATTKSQDSAYNFDTHAVLCFQAEYISPHIEWKQKRTNAKGETRIFPADYDSNDNVIVKDTAKRKTYRTSADMVYGATSVVGTEYVFDCGLKDNIIRDGEKVELNYAFIHIPGESITKRCIPVYNQIQIDWLQYQNGRAKASPPGIAAEFSSLSNITIGGRVLHPLEVLTLRRANGDLIYRANTHFTQNLGSQASPITELQGGSGQVVQDFIDAMNVNLELLREFSGITEAASATNINPRMGLGLNELQQEATQNSLFTVADGYKSLLTRVAEKDYKLIQNVLKAYEDPEENPYYGTLSTLSLEVGKIIAETSRAKLGVRIIPRSTQAERQRIEEMALASVKANKEGGVGITAHDYFLIMRLVGAGNVKRAELEIGLREEKRRVERQQEMVLATQAAGEEERKKKLADAELTEKLKNREELIRVNGTIMEEKETALIEIDKQRQLDNLAIEKLKKMRSEGLLDFATVEKV